jgi:hypothetical protein
MRQKVRMATVSSSPARPSLTACPDRAAESRPDDVVCQY